MTLNNDTPYEIPVLLIMFNRSEHALKVLEVVRKVKPSRIYVAGDGPRAEKAGEDIRCEIARKNVLDAIDWKCEVKTLFRKDNVGSGFGPTNAITWFFEHEEAGIILEDDCVPSISFFHFCEHFLRKFMNDNRIWMISGTNLLKTWEPHRVDYFYSIRGGTWGWASWRRAWQHYDFTIKSWADPYVQDLIRNMVDANTWKALYQEYEMTYNGFDEKQSVWDYQWNFARLINSGLSIMPSKNLISNIGFGDEATHTFDDSPWANLQRFEYEFPLRENSIVIPDMNFERRVHEMIHLKIWQRVSRKFKKISSSVLKA